MGLLNALLGSQSEISPDRIEEEISTFLIPDERIEHAFQMVRDVTVFTNRRMIVIDKQGFTGRKKDYLSIPYSSITKFSKETAGSFDLDAEIKLWIRGEAVPIALEFRNDKNVHDVYRVISMHVL